MTRVGAEVVVTEIVFTVNIMRFSHPETSPHHAWKSCLPQNQSLAPKRLGTAAWSLEAFLQNSSGEKSPSQCLHQAWNDLLGKAAGQGPEDEEGLFPGRQQHKESTLREDRFPGMVVRDVLSNRLLRRSTPLQSQFPETVAPGILKHQCSRGINSLGHQQSNVKSGRPAGGTISPPRWNSNPPGGGPVAPIYSQAASLCPAGGPSFPPHSPNRACSLALSSSPRDLKERATGVLQVPKYASSFVPRIVDGLLMGQSGVGWLPGETERLLLSPPS